MTVIQNLPQTQQTMPDLAVVAATLPRITSESRKTYHYAMVSYQKFCAKEGLAQDLDSVMSWLKSMSNSNTQRVYVAAVKKVLKEVYRFDPRLSQIVQALEDIRPSQRVQAITRSRYLLREEVEKMLKHTPPGLSLMIEFFFWTGMRVSEVARTEIKNCVKVDSVYEIRVVGKRNKENVHFIQDKLFLRIQKHFQGKKYLFEHDGCTYSREILSRNIKKYGKKILQKDISAHTMRRSLACYLRDERRMSIDKIQKVLNHSSIGTTAIYLCGKPTAEEIGIPGTKKTRARR